MIQQKYCFMNTTIIIALKCFEMKKKYVVYFKTCRRKRANRRIDSILYISRVIKRPQHVVTLSYLIVSVKETNISV